jgi:Rv2525c-like, glycoside hydrolase-like domain
VIIPGCDGAEQPSGAALAAAGLVFMARYLPYKLVDGSWNPKGLTAAQVADLRAHGIAIVPNWEQVSTRANQGYAAGVSDASTSSGALINLGFPAEQGVYFSVDFPTNGYTAAQWAPIDAYFDGVASVLRVARTWVYGGYDTIAHFVANGKASKFWQTRAWSGTPPKIHPRADIYQPAKTQVVGGVTVDLDMASVQDYGQWPAPGGDMPIYTVGGMQAFTAVSSSPTPYYHNPGDTKAAGNLQPGQSYLMVAFDATGAWAAVTSDYLQPVGTTLLQCGWVKVADVHPAPLPAPVKLVKYTVSTEVLAPAQPVTVTTQEA